jgi:hypothetical protein
LSLPIADGFARTLLLEYLHGGHALHKSVVFVLCLVFPLLCAGCKGSPGAPGRARHVAQQTRLDTAIEKLEKSADRQSDAETLRLLKDIRKELAESMRRETEAQQRIAALNDEVAGLRHAAGFAVDHIEVLYITHVTDEGIDLWVTPFDRHNDVVKTAGSFDVSLHRPGAWGLRKMGPVISAWRLSAREVEQQWEGQLFEGYHLKLAWGEGKPSDVKTATLRVQFTTAEGKVFTATKELSIGDESP